MHLKFLGAAGTVTGSKYLLSEGSGKFLLDCGLYQGVKALRERNWKPFPAKASEIKSVVLSHAHLDHSGYIPALMKHGFKGKVFCTPATYALAKVLLPDSGFLQEEDARYANKRKFSKHSPALPLYTEKDAWEALKHFETVDFHETFSPIHGVTAEIHRAGHILGAGSVQLSGGKGSIVFSGDLGRQEDRIMYPPETIAAADYLVVESTYGDRLHEKVDVRAQLSEAINATAKRGGIVLIPSFAVGRAQHLLYLIQLLKADNSIPDLPVFLNSPMAISATEIFCHYHKEHRLTAEDCALIDQNTHFIRSVEESIELNRKKFPCIIVSASGMASGGRVLHHLKTLLPDHRNTIVFAGFQAPGTRGDALTHGAEKVKIHGEYFPVKAEVINLESLSAHADYAEILSWLKGFKQPPRHTYVTHGESVAADALRLRIADELGWRASAPEYLDEAQLEI
ncbi:MBL fold metallo-hydrolase [Hahella sp. KA22]|uniref:MBL fold metallo-hydrolase RNA specificity domain-containing protein n=1 Tax=Hahella sp. KA22 TaxID=1628392 RepID=UPI000FDD7FEC|nr:MBL fold metallo-hydrolase [Hahella sp. KA22]AZZ93904.1 MBL fold metallo-hydrolase [Hahella sp. KA22]QAY57277.1 MBL fold metallo-hydrolase [Hahella sp. KA22]